MGTRDTDWYEITVNEDTEFTWMAEADFDVVIGLVPTIPDGTGDCNDGAGYVSPFSVGSPCVLVSITTACLPAGTYWFFVAPTMSGPTFDCNDYVATLTCVPCVTGDDCTEPVQVVLGPGDLPYTNNNSTCGRGNDYSDTCLGYYDSGEDIIYELFVTEAMNVNITLDPHGTTYTGIAIDDSCPPDGSCIELSTSSSAGPHGFVVHLEPGTYYIMVDTWASPDCIPDFTLTIGPDPGDDCNDPVLVTLSLADLPYSNTNTTCARGDDYNDTCLGYYDGGEDIIYELNVTDAMDVRITLDPCDTTYTGIALDDSCPPDSTCLALSTSSSADRHGFVVHLEPGTYYIMVDTWASPDCIPDFTLTIIDYMALGDDCTDPVPVTLDLNDLPYTNTNTTCVRGNDYSDTCLGYYDSGEDIIYEVNVTEAMNVNITLDPYGTHYVGIAIDDNCPPDDSCIELSTSSSADPHGFTVHLEPATYYIMVDTWASPDCIPDFTLTMEDAGPSPANDDCENAQPVGDVADLPFDTMFATFDGGGTCMTSPNIWYCYTATCTGNVTVSLCGSSYDTKLAVYNGCNCQPLGALIGCNDDFGFCPIGGGLQSQITFAAFAGHDYLIEVGGYSNQAGPGLLSIWCQEQANVKWFQQPDMTPAGMDIRISDDGSGSNQVADDFECNKPGLLTHVRLWCSWKNDEQDNIYDFTLTIREDIPANTQNPYDSNIYDYSMPGKVLWSRQFGGGLSPFEPIEFRMSLCADLSPEYEWFWDPFWGREPNSMGDHRVWQVDFNIDPRVAFRQQGTPDNPVTYWLQVNAQTSQSTNSKLGWKTSTDHWNDDAVWWDWRIYPAEPMIYRDLRYPPGHPYEPNSIDVAFMIATTAEANEPNGPIKWLQRPDETREGMDIRCDRSDQVPRWLADDFSCTTTGPITSIHLWGSWRDDFVTLIEWFHLSIHEDLAPYDPCNPHGYSMPGDEVWSRYFFRGLFQETLYLDLYPDYEYWFDPYGPFDEPNGDQRIWQYDFYIDPCDAFIQQGDPCQPRIYWLNVYVEMQPTFPPPEFGWKTSPWHWNDWAVYWDLNLNEWAVLWYPDGHSLHGSPVDMAFMITQPEEPELDFGDAPDPNYPTLLASDGARHIIGGPHFCDAVSGDAPDPEADGQPHPWATGDDTDGNDDEDGVSFPVLVQGQPSVVSLNVCGGGGIVEIWIDYNDDEDWDDPGELEFSGYMGNGPNTIVVNPPAGSVIGQTFARCRISTAGIGLPTGQADDGEVEDHIVEIEQVLTCWDNITQCAGQSHGDSTCDGWINLGDLFALKMYFGTAAPWTPPECCSDYNHDNSVNLGDLFVLKMWFGTGPYAPATGNQNCP
jgi:hypothetical protein